jgi:predicted GNAT family acetyltransferase
MADEIRDNESEQRFELWHDGELAGVMTYEAYAADGGTRALNHTEIDDRFEGQGLGSEFVAGVLDRLRESGESVLPYCPFVRAYLSRHTEDVDLVPEERRAQFDL